MIQTGLVNTVTPGTGKLIRFLAITCCFLLAFSMQAESGAIEVVESEGVVQSLNFENNTVEIDGLSYTVAVDAKVEIRGTYGAFTLLEQGMKLAFSYRRFNGTHREIVTITQLSDNRELDQT